MNDISKKPEITNSEIEKPNIPTTSASKPFGSKAGSKPNFMSKGRTETSNANQNIASKPFS